VGGQCADAGRADEAGFTLIEIMVVVFILGLLSRCGARIVVAPTRPER